MFNGDPVPEHLTAGLTREWERLQMATAQLKTLESEIMGLIEKSEALKPVRSLMHLTGIGWVGAGTLVLELLGWREIANRCQLASLSGLVPAPYNSGTMERDQGIWMPGRPRRGSTRYCSSIGSMRSRRGCISWRASRG